LFFTSISYSWWIFTPPQAKPMIYGSKKLNKILRKRQTRQKRLKHIQEHRQKILKQKIKRIQKIPDILNQQKLGGFYDKRRY
jgi:hypothetical protein